MKLTCARETLLKAVRSAEALLMNKSINKADLLIDATTDMTRIFSTDMETSVIVNISANISENGSVAVFGKKLSEVLSSLTNDDISINVTAENQMKVKSLSKESKALFTLKGQPGKEFNQIPQITNDHVFSIEQRVMKNMIRKVITSSSNDDTRYVLNGVLFNASRDRLKMVATDGRRLSLISSQIKGPAQEQNVIVSKRVLSEMEKMLGTEGQCQIGISEKNIFLSFDNTYIVSRLIEGDFPDYKQVIPAAFDFEVTFEQQSLFNAVKGISLMANENYKRLNLSIKHKAAQFTSSDPEIGDAVDEIIVKDTTKQGDTDFDIAFNCFFLMDILKVIDSEQIVFKFNKNTNPALVQEKGNDDYLSVIMPMKSV